MVVVAVLVGVDGVVGVVEACLDVFDGVGFFADDGVAVWGEVGAVEDAACAASTWRASGVEEFVFGVASVFADDVGVGLRDGPKVARFVMVASGVGRPGGVVEVGPLLFFRYWSEGCDEAEPGVVGVGGQAELVNIRDEEEVRGFDLLVPGFVVVPGCEWSQQQRGTDGDAGDRGLAGPFGQLGVGVGERADDPGPGLVDPGFGGLGWVGVGVVAEAVFGAFRDHDLPTWCRVVDGVSLRGDRDTGPFVLNLQ